MCWDLSIGGAGALKVNIILERERRNNNKICVVVLFFFFFLMYRINAFIDNH
jgi:hypothetical protein